MATERSDGIYAQYLESVQKFDYFMVGIAVAVVGYLGSALDPVTVAWSSALLEPGALASLLVSVFAGLKRIQVQGELLRLTFRRLYAEESAGAMTKVATEGRQAVNTSSGEVINPGEAMRQRELRLLEAEAASQLLDSSASSGYRWYRVRNVFFMLGFALLILSRVQFT